MQAENRHGEFWGEQRLENLLRSCSGKTPKQIIEGILDQVSAFLKGHRQRDDITLVVIGRAIGLRRLGLPVRRSPSMQTMSRDALNLKSQGQQNSDGFGPSP
jgi:hypothetical protein